MVRRIVPGLLLAAVLALGISLVGWVSKQLIGQKLIDYVAAHVIQRIPVLRSVYNALEQLLRTLAQGGGHQFHPGGTSDRQWRKDCQ